MKGIKKKETKWRVLTGNNEEKCVYVHGEYATKEAADEIAAQLGLDNPGMVIKVVATEVEMELVGLLPGNAGPAEIKESVKW